MRELLGRLLCCLDRHKYRVVHREPYLGHPTMTRTIWRCGRPGCWAQIVEPDDIFGP